MNPETQTAPHTRVTVTVRDLHTLLLAGAGHTLLYTTAGLTVDDLIDGDSDSGYGIIGDLPGQVVILPEADADRRERDEQDVARVATVDDVLDLLATKTLPDAAAWLTAAIRDGFYQ